MPRPVDFDPFADEDERQLKTPRDLGIDVLDAGAFLRNNQLDLSGGPQEYDAFSVFGDTQAKAMTETFAKPAAPAGPGVFGSSFGMLTPEESQADLRGRREAYTQAQATISQLERLRDLPINRNRQAALQSQIDARKAALPDLAQIERMEQGQAPLATKTALRSGIENAARGAAETVVAVPEMIGIVKGYLQPGQVDEDSLLQWSLSAKDWLQQQFPGDAARQADFSQQFASGLGQVATFYGSGALAALLKAGPKAAAAVVAMLGSSAVGSQGFEEGTRELAAAKQKAEAEGRTADVTEYDRLLKTLGYTALGATEAIPIARTFSRIAPEPTTSFGNRILQSAEGAAEEALQESGSQFGQNVVTQNTTDPARGTLDGLGESAAVGGALGGLMNFLLPGRFRATPQKNDDASAMPGTAAVPVGPSGGFPGQPMEEFRGALRPAPGEAITSTESTGTRGQPLALPAPATTTGEDTDTGGEPAADGGTETQSQALRGEIERQVRANPGLAPMMADIMTRFDDNPQLVGQAAVQLTETGKLSRVANDLMLGLQKMPSGLERQQFGATTNAMTLPAGTAAPVPTGRPTASGTAPEMVPEVADLPFFALGGNAQAGPELDEQGYYSKALETAKAIPQPRGSGEQFLGMLRNAGVKQSEIDATGVGKWLAGKPQVSRDELVQFLTDLRVKLDVSTRAAPTTKEKIAQHRFGRSYTALNEDDRAFVDYDWTEQHHRSRNQPKFTRYSLDPSNPTYSEDVLHLGPTARQQQIDARIAEINKEKDEIDSDRRRYPGLESEHIARLDALTEEYHRLNAEEAEMARGSWTSGHWPEPNIIAHLRTQQLQTTDGRTSLNLDELQSDEGQKIREGGVADPEKAARLWEEAAVHSRARNELRSSIDSTLMHIFINELDAGKYSGAQRAELESLRDEETGVARLYMRRLSRGRMDDMDTAPANSRPYVATQVGNIIGGKTGRSLIDMANKEAFAAGEFERLNAEAFQASHGAVGHPLINTTDQWVETALRHLITKAVRDGVDGISITPAKVQNERFGLGAHLESLTYQLQTDGQYGLWGRRKGGGRSEEFGIYPADQLNEVVGREMADKIRAGEGAQSGYYGEDAGKKTFEGVDLEVGGEGMRATYDQMYPRALGKILAKLDKSIKPEKVRLVSSGFDPQQSMPRDYQDWSEDTPFGNDFIFFPLTDLAKAKIEAEGLPMFALGGEAPQELPGTPPTKSDFELKLPFKEKWGDPRFNEADRDRAIARLEQIQSMPVNSHKKTSWADIVRAAEDINEIALSLYYYRPEVSNEDIRRAWEPYAFMQMQKPGVIRENLRGSIFDGQDNKDPEVATIAKRGYFALLSLFYSRRAGVQKLLEDGDRRDPDIRPGAERRDDAGRKLRSGFYFASGRMLKEIPEQIFQQGGQAVINWLTQAGITKAEIEHMGLTQFVGQKPVSREAMAAHMARRIFDFKRKTSWHNPEISPGDYGDEIKTRVHAGPRIPGRGIYFERLMAFPVKTKGGDPLAAGYFISPHWDEELEPTWASWRGTLREVPGWGKMTVGEEGQSDFMQGASARVTEGERQGESRRPRVAQAEYLKRYKQQPDYMAKHREVFDAIELAYGYGKFADGGISAGRNMIREQLTRGMEPQKWREVFERMRNKFRPLPGEQARNALDKLNDAQEIIRNNADYFRAGHRDRYAGIRAKFTPESPIDSVYVRTMVRDLLLHAVQQNADSIAVSTTETNDRIQANTRMSAGHFYDQQLRPSLQKELRRLTGDGKLTLEQVKLPKAQGSRPEKSYTVWAAKLPKSLKEQIRRDGLPMFALRDIMPLSDAEITAGVELGARLARNWQQALAEHYGTRPWPGEAAVLGVLANAATRYAETTEELAEELKAAGFGRLPESLLDQGLMASQALRIGQEDESFALDGFHNPLIKAVAAAKQARATPQQWKKLLQAQGVPQELMTFTGVLEWLEEQEALRANRPGSNTPAADKTMTREEVLDFLNSHDIAIDKETLLSEGPPEWQAEQQRIADEENARRRAAWEATNQNPLTLDQIDAILAEEFPEDEDGDEDFEDPYEGMVSDDEREDAIRSLQEGYYEHYEMEAFDQAMSEWEEEHHYDNFKPEAFFAGTREEEKLYLDAEERWKRARQEWQEALILQPTLPGIEPVRATDPTAGPQLKDYLPEDLRDEPLWEYELVHTGRHSDIGFDDLDNSEPRWTRDEAEEAAEEALDDYRRGYDRFRERETEDILEGLYEEVYRQARRQAERQWDDENPDWVPEDERDDPETLRLNERYNAIARRRRELARGNQPPPEVTPKPWISTVRWKANSIQGGQHYTELLVTLPMLREAGFESPHFRNSEVVHVRFDTRQGPNGERVLLIHEIQSDLHQRARAFGYGPKGLEKAEEALKQKGWTPETVAQLQALSAEEKALEDASTEVGDPRLKELRKQIAKLKNEAGDRSDKASRYINNFKSTNGAPDAPFKSDRWWQLGFKAALQEAVDGHFDAIALTTPVQARTATSTPEHVAQKFYGENIPRFADKYMKKWGSTRQDLPVSGTAQKFAKADSEYRYALLPGVDVDKAIDFYEPLVALYKRTGQTERGERYSRLVEDLKRTRPEGEALVSRILEYDAEFLAYYGYADPQTANYRQLMTRDADGPAQPYWPLTPQVKADITAVGQSLAAGQMSEAEIERVMLQALARGQSIDMRQQAEDALGQIGRSAEALPAEAGLFALARLEPIPDERQYLRATFIDKTGRQRTEIKSVSLLFGTRAYFQRARAAGSVGPGVFVIHLGPSGDFSETLSGEIRHEAVHALRDLGHFPAADWARLVGHAKDLQILKMRLGDYLLGIGRESITNGGGKLIGDVYWEFYKNVSDRNERMDQEAVAHMVELYSHGLISQEELDPIVDLLDKIVNGDYAKPRSTPPSGRRDASAQQGQLLALNPVDRFGKAIKDDPKFKRWFKDSKVVDADGNPKIVYHATLNEFQAFDPGKRNPESNVGAGFYFSDSIADIRNNYSHEDGPDMRGRIGQMAYVIANEYDDLGEMRPPEDDVRELAKRRLGMVHEGTTMPVYLSIQNPVVLGGKKPTFFDYDSGEVYDEEADDYEYGDPSGKFVAFVEAFEAELRKLDSLYSGYGQKVIESLTSSLWELANEQEGSYAPDIYRTLYDNNSSTEVTDDEGRLIIQEVVRRAFEQMGYDGIIDRSVPQKFPGMVGIQGATHYIVFHPNQIKSALGNTGEFDPDQDDISLAFAGEKAVTADLSARDKAMAMQELGQSPEEILRETGWHLGPDGRWRFEIDDSQMTIKLSPEQLRARAASNPQLMLPDLIDHPQLFNAYPQLAKIRVELLNDATLGFAGGFSPAMTVQEGDQQLVRPATLQLNIGDLSFGQGATQKGTLIHELQHAIQFIEDFATGGNLDVAYFRFIDRLLEGRLTPADRDLVKKRGGRPLLTVLENNKPNVAWIKAMRTPGGSPPALTPEQEAKKLNLREAFYGLARMISLDLYKRLAGESEARLVDERRDMPPQLRQQTYPEPDIADQEMDFIHPSQAYGHLKAGVYSVSPIRPGVAMPQAGQQAPVKDYIAHTLEATDAKATSEETLYRDYHGYARAQGLTPLPPQAFMQELREQGLHPIKIAGQRRYLVAIRGGEDDEAGSKIGQLLRRAKQLMGKGGVPKTTVTEQTGWSLDDNGHWQFKMTEAAKTMIEGKPKKPDKK